MTSKLSFRARALDASKPMAIFNEEDLPELESIPAINRAVPALPTGMEKEEESEKHLQDILKSSKSESKKESQGGDASPAGTANGSQKKESGSAGRKKGEILVIPTPEVMLEEDDGISSLYSRAPDFKLGRQFIHVQPLASDGDNPDYDMDNEDAAFFNDVLKKKFGDEESSLTELEFEDMIDRLEKNSGIQVVSVRDAKHILSQDDEIIFAVYDYWVDKRLRLKMPLIPTLKSAEIICPSGASSSASSASQSSSSSHNPYVCFRRRTEKMQTRKNRKNDEASYEKMLKLRRDLNRAVTLLEMVRRREKMKKENLEFGADILEKRYAAQDWDGKMISEMMAGTRIRSCSGVLQPFAQPNLSNYGASVDEEASRKEKRSYKKRKKGSSANSNSANVNNASLTGRGLSTPGANYASLKNSNGPEFGTSISSDDEALSPSDVEEDELEGPFAFRRKRGCQYLAPIEDFGDCQPVWPWEHEPKYRYSLASLSTPKPRCVGLVRRRIGRGGRVLLDRAYTNYDDLWNSLDFTITDQSDFGTFRPVTPPHCREEDWDPYKRRLSETSSLPTIPLKPLPFAAVQAVTANHHHSGNNRQRAVSGVKTVAVDPVGALNAASALVSNNVLEMFDSNN